MNFSYLIILLFILTFFWLSFLTISFLKFRQRYGRVVEAGEKEGLGRIVDQSLEEVKSLQEELQKLKKQEKVLQELLKKAFRKVEVVRFDAFDDIGGKLSFATAFLNDEGDGVVISSIYGRGESRTYAKPVIRGESSYTLSQEEKEAINKASKPT